MPAQPWRCDVTGNPVGTDTRAIGAAPCACQGCRAASEIERLREEVKAWRERFPVAGFDGKSIVLSG